MKEIVSSIFIICASGLVLMALLYALFCLCKDMATKLIMKFCATLDKDGEISHLRKEHRKTTYFYVTVKVGTDVFDYKVPVHIWKSLAVGGTVTLREHWQGKKLIATALVLGNKSFPPETI